jgi:hypothetical protein
LIIVYQDVASSWSLVKRHQTVTKVTQATELPD